MLLLLICTTMCSIVSLGLDLWLLFNTHRYGRHHDHLIPDTPRAPRG